MKATELQVAALIHKVCPRVTIDESGFDAAFKDFDIDSLDVAGIFLEIADVFDVLVPDDEIDGLSTVRKLTARLNQAT